MAFVTQDIPGSNLNRDGNTSIASQSITPLRVRNGYVAIAPKSAAMTSKSQPFITPSESSSPDLPQDITKSRVAYPSQTRSVSKALESRLQRQNGSEVITKVAVDPGKLISPKISADYMGAITPALLAKYHLPDILLNHGPLAIRHIMSFLTTTVPGFSRISPTKSRRLVVNALEKGLNEDIVRDFNTSFTFEKVGWGRWDAKTKHSSSGEGKNQTMPIETPPFRSDGFLNKKSDKRNTDLSYFKTINHSWADDSTSISHGENMDINIDLDTIMAESQMDKTSIYDNDTCSSTLEASDDDDDDDDDEIMSDSSSDTTDDEDWAALGAAALRAASYSSSNNEANFLSSLAYAGVVGRNGGPYLSTVVKSSPKQHFTMDDINIAAAAFDKPSNTQEREAIEALLHLSSV